MKKTLYALLLLVSFLCTLAPLQAQLEVRLEPVRREFVLGEQVLLKLTLQNMTDQRLNLQNYPGRPWLNFSITQQPASNTMTPKSRPLFPKVSIAPGQRVSFEINIKPYYKLNQEGTFKAVATIIMPNGHDAYSSQRASFVLIPGASMTKFRVQSRGRNLTLHSKLARINGVPCIFGQVMNNDTNTVVGACFVGKYLNFMEPKCVMDGAQNLHILCQSTPKYFSYAVMNTAGQRIRHQVYLRTAGPLALVPGARGVQIIGAVPYKKTNTDDSNTIRKITDRPF